MKTFFVIVRVDKYEHPKGGEYTYVVKALNRLHAMDKVREYWWNTRITGVYATEIDEREMIEVTVHRMYFLPAGIKYRRGKAS